MNKDTQPLDPMGTKVPGFRMPSGKKEGTKSDKFFRFKGAQSHTVLFMHALRFLDLCEEEEEFLRGFLDNVYAPYEGTDLKEAMKSKDLKRGWDAVRKLSDLGQSLRVEGEERYAVALAIGVGMLQSLLLKIWETADEES